ncbi:MAG TPA: ATP-binding protein [Gemmatimonadaceae bacterium]|jgi:PAS domain S-box-containing protein|nr:ATP-binding protein [Gemmatimonadaceae bacterium]
MQKHPVLPDHATPDTTKTGSVPDFRAVFERAPGAAILVAADAPVWTIVGVTEAYLAVTHQQRETLIGGRIFEAFPESPETGSAQGEHNVRTSFERAVSSGEANELPLQRYDLPRPSGDGYDEHYWRMGTIPILDADGQVVFLLHHVQNVTSQVQMERELATAKAQTVTARGETEDAERRASFMAHATPLLFGSMDYERTLSNLAHVAVPTIGDWCAIDIMNDDGTLRRLAVAHQDPAKIELALTLERKYPEDPTTPTSRVQALRTGVPRFIPEITDAMIDQGARTPEHAQLIRTLGLRSVITAPLIAHERRLGTITVVMAESGRLYTQRDVELVQDLAQRAASAIDNARLHREVVEQRNQLETANRELALQTTRLEDVVNELENANQTLHEQAIEMEQSQQTLEENAAELEIQGDTLRRANDALAEREARYRFLANAIPVQVWTAKPDGSLDYVSQGVTDYFGKSESEMLGEGWLDVIHADDLERATARWSRSLTTGEPYEIEFRLWSHVHNAYRWHLGRAVALRDADGTIEQWFGSNTDIEDQKRVENERERLQREAENANRAKMEFLAAMSHELRTPLNAIGGYVELMEMGVVGPVTAEQHDYLARVQRSSKFLLGLINDVLNFAKIDAGVIEIRRDAVHLNTILSTVHTLVEPQMQAKQLVYACDILDDSAVVCGDREKIEQILLNLLTNASKFTDPGGGITLSYTVDGRFARIRVADTGRGIPAEKLESVFDPFVQIGRTTNIGSQQGVGLGLAISRDLAVGMGGNLSVESTVGAGSTFTLSLPLMEPADP